MYGCCFVSDVFVGVYQNHARLYADIRISEHFPLISGKDDANFQNRNQEKGRQEAPSSLWNIMKQFSRRSELRTWLMLNGCILRVGYPVI